MKKLVATFLLAVLFVPVKAQVTQVEPSGREVVSTEHIIPLRTDSKTEAIGADAVCQKKMGKVMCGVRVLSVEGSIDLRRQATVLAGEDTVQVFRSQYVRRVPYSNAQVSALLLVMDTTAFEEVVNASRLEVHIRNKVLYLEKDHQKPFRRLLTTLSQ